ncbi:hypothetical protein SLS61_003048 [Didymella pomorum]
MVNIQVGEGANGTELVIYEDLLRYIFPVADPDTFAPYQQLIYTGRIPRDSKLVVTKITEPSFEDTDDHPPKKPYVRCGDKHLCGEEYYRLASVYTLAYEL